MEEEKKVEAKKPYPYAYPPGRPCKYEPEMDKIVIDLMSQGASKIEVAATLGISKSTLYEWLEKVPGFSAVIERGEMLSQQWWEREGRLSLRDKEFNGSLWYMNMKNRHGWKDRQDTTVTATVKQEDAIKELG